MILSHMELVTLTAREYREAVQHCATTGWAGGHVHDAIHLRCALKTHGDRIFTFNVKDFRAMSTDELEDRIVAP